MTLAEVYVKWSVILMYLLGQTFPKFCIVSERFWKFQVVVSLKWISDQKSCVCFCRVWMKLVKVVKEIVANAFWAKLEKTVSFYEQTNIRPSIFSSHYRLFCLLPFKCFATCGKKSYVLLLLRFYPSFIRFHSTLF